MGTTHRLATHGEEVIMKFFALLPTLLSAVAADGYLPIAAQHVAGAGLYHGHAGVAAAAYAPAYAGVEARFAYGQPITALNAGPLTAGPVAAAAPAVAVPAYTAAAPVIGAQYAAAYSAPAIAAPVAYGAAAPVAYGAAAPVAYGAAAPVAYGAAAPVAYGAAAPVAYGGAAPVAYGGAAPVIAAAPAIAAAPVAYGAAAPAIAAPAITSSQFQAQDESGNIAYGYQNINSAKQERGNTYGGVEGSYSYTDEAGVHTVNYIADDYGFRVVGDNHPVAPVHAAVAPVAPVYTGVAPVAVVDTPAVAEAKAAFFAAYDEAASRHKRSAQYLPGGLPAAPVAHAVAPVAPVAYAAAPAAPSREAILTTIKLNPGHAIFYRVD